MTYYIGCDAHKHFSLFAVLDDDGHLHERIRINHAPGAIKNYLSQFPEGTTVALESVGNWYWIVDEIEASGCVPKMAHAAKAKVMMGNVNKTDKLDAKGLATLERLGSLPTVWLPPGDLRDERDLPRTRMAITKIRTALKNRIHSTWPSTTCPSTPAATSSLPSGAISFCTLFKLCPQRPSAVWNRSLNSSIMCIHISSA